MSTPVHPSRLFDQLEYSTVSWADLLAQLLGVRREWQEIQLRADLDHQLKTATSWHYLMTSIEKLAQYEAGTLEKSASGSI